jgi:hypothetical protein
MSKEEKKVKVDSTVGVNKRKLKLVPCQVIESNHHIVIQYSIVCRTL